MKKNKTLKNFYFSDNEIGQEQTEQFCQMLKENKTLEVIDLSGNQIFFDKKEIVQQFFEILGENQFLRELIINEVGFESSNQTDLIFQFIRSNHPSLKKIYLFLNLFTKNSSISIYDSLKHNFHLTKIVLYEDHFRDQEFWFLMKRKINFLLNCNKKWKAEKHIYFHKLFKQSVFTFVLCLKENQKNLSFKIPKFVLLEIVKKIDRRSFNPVY